MIDSKAVFSTWQSDQNPESEAAVVALLKRCGPLVFRARLYSLTDAGELRADPRPFSVSGYTYASGAHPEEPAGFVAPPPSGAVLGPKLVTVQGKRSKP